jgi:hypothetical protein
MTPDPAGTLALNSSSPEWMPRNFPALSLQIEEGSGRGTLAFRLRGRTTCGT